MKSEKIWKKNSSIFFVQDVAWDLQKCILEVFLKNLYTILNALYLSILTFKTPAPFSPFSYQNHYNFRLINLWNLVKQLLHLLVPPPLIILFAIVVDVSACTFKLFWSGFVGKSLVACRPFSYPVFTSASTHKQNRMPIENFTQKNFKKLVQTQSF